MASGWIVDKEPTTEAEGCKHKECEVCGEKLQTEAIEKLYLTATTDSKGEAVVGGYLVIVTDTQNPAANAKVSLNKSGSISIRLPNGRILDYADQTTVTVLLTKDKSPVQGMILAVTDKNDNYCAGATDKSGQLTVSAANGYTNGDGKVTFGYEDKEGNRQTLTVIMTGHETGRPIENAYVTIEKSTSQAVTADMFISIVRKYTRAKKLTPRMLNELIEKIEVHQAEKVDGVWEQHLTIQYNCIGAIDIPDVLPLPYPEVSVNTRKGVVATYVPNTLTA